MRYAVLVGIIIVAVPLLLRLGAPEPFYDAESYGALRESELSEYDSLYAQPHEASVSDVLFGHMPPQLLLIILAAATMFALSAYHGSEVFLLLFATSPVFVTTYTRVGDAAVGVTAIALGVMLISRRQYWAVLVIPLCFSLSFSLGILASLTFIAIALVEGMPFVALGTSFFALLSGVIVALTARTIDIGFHIPRAGQFLNVLTTTQGITIFLIALGVIGFLRQYVTAGRKAEQLLILLIFPFAIFFEHGSIIVVAFLAFLGSKAWHFLQQRRWQFEEIRTLTLVLIACGILFTAMLAVRERTVVDEERVEVTRFIAAAYPIGTPIAADPDLAPVLAYYGYPSRTPVLPQDSDLTAASLRKEGYTAIATSEEGLPYSHFPITYKGNRYTVYELPE